MSPNQPRNAVPTMTRAIEAILDALDDHDLPTAREHFHKTAHNSPSAASDLAIQLAATAHIPTGTVVFGFGIDIWNNPYRADYAWRCGDCRWTGSNYHSMRDAEFAADAHTADHQAEKTPKPVVVEYGSEQHTTRTPS